MSLKMGELFAGYGGLGMGVSAVLDTELAWVSEFDKGPSKILAHRFPGVPNHGDITKIDWSQVEPVDILTGGSPCQDLSHAGRRAGMTEGARSNLWVAMREAIAQLRPSLVVWENVGGAFSAAADSEVEPCAGCVGDGSGVNLRALGRVLGDLSSLGFDAEWVAVRAADVGAPHGRLRVFVTAYPKGDTGRVDDRNPVAASLASSLRRRAGWSTGPGEAPGGRASADVAGRSDAPLTVLPTPTTRDHKDHTIRREPHRPDDMGASYTPDEWDAWTDRMKAEHGNGNGHGKSLHIEAARLASDDDWWTEEDARRAREQDGIEDDVDRLLPTPKTVNRVSRKAMTQRQWSRPALEQAVEIADGVLPRELESWDEIPGNSHTTWGQYAAAIHRWESLTRPAPAPTETGPKGNPRLSAAFSEWMMGLPAGWVTDVPDITRNEALKALGNGVVPQQAAAALRVLLGVQERAA